MIKNLVFDFGKVLLDYDFKRSVLKYFESEEDFEVFHKKYINEEFMGICDIGTQPLVDCYRQAAEQDAHFASQLMHFYESYVDFVTGEIPGMRALLQEYKAKGYKLYGITNWCTPIFTIMESYPEIFGLLDGRIISCEEHMLKPYPDIYLRLLEKYGLKAEECVFADDKAPNVHGAEAVGMYGIVFKDEKQYRAELEKLL